MTNKKGAVWVSAVIYVMIAVVVMVIVLEAGLPLIEGLTERNAFNKIRDTLVSVDKQIQQVASEGQGSQRVIPLEIFDGELKIQDEKLRWKLETDSKLVEPNSRVELGNLIISSDVDVTAATEDSFFVIQNSRIKVNFSNVGSASSFQTINTSAIVNSITFKETGEASSGTFTFFVNDSDSQNGNGYTILEKTGSGLTSASVRAHINNTAMSYDIVLAVDSKADFFRASIENFNKK